MVDCVFCNIVTGKIKTQVVYDDEHFIGFLDIAPGNKGHTLVVPKQHVEVLDKLPDKLAQELIIKVKKIAHAIQLALDPDGYNVLMNNHKAAGQIVPHVHFHIIPRYSHDEIKFTWPVDEYVDDKEKESYQEKIKAKL